MTEDKWDRLLDSLAQGFTFWGFIICVLTTFGLVLAALYAL